MLIINTGGTFNKRYDKITGKLYVPKDSIAILDILKNYPQLNYEIHTIISKDSLDITDEDREEIANIALNSNEKNIIIIHGTDTMEQTASYLKPKISNKKIILTGAMKPYEIDNAEASVNIAMSIGFMQGSREDDIYICMSGLVDVSNKISKDRKQGIFYQK